MFKVGEEVVFIGTDRKPRFKGFNYPKKNEIVTIDGLNTDGVTYDVKGFKKDNFGRTQSFYGDNFRKLDHSFAEEVLANIKEQVKEESLELV